MDENPHSQHTHGFQQRFCINVGRSSGQSFYWAFLLQSHLKGHTYLPARSIGRIIGRCVTENPSRPLVWTWWRNSPFCRCDSWSPQEIFREDMDRSRWPDCMASTIAGLKATRFFLLDHMKSLVCQTPVGPVEDLLTRVLGAAQGIIRHQVQWSECTRTWVAGRMCATSSVVAILNRCCSNESVITKRSRVTKLKF